MGVMQTDDVFFRTALTYLAQAEFTGRRNSNVSGFSAVSVGGNRLPYSPEWIASAAVGYALGDVAEFQLELQHTGDQFTDDLNTTAPTVDGQRGKIESATILNFTLNATPFDNGAGIFFAIKNITDELTIVDRSRGILPGAPRLVQAGFTHRF
jgi:Fe(3+) dicitrate transport protein